MSKQLRWMLITASPEVARHAEAAGVHRIFIDMETRGKAERQGHLDTHKSAHSLADVERVRAVLRTSELMVRINPPGPETPSEVDAAIAAGASRLMLPMFSTVHEVEDFLAAVAGRVPVTLLVETPAALVRLACYLPLLRAGDQVHFGLNDLSIGAGLRFLFEPLAGGLLETPAALCRSARVPFGFGGVGRVGHGELPAEWIVGEHVRLGSDWVILSRAFHGGAADVQALRDELDLDSELARLRAVEQAFREAGTTALEENRQRLASRVFEIAGQGNGRA